MLSKRFDLIQQLETLTSFSVGLGVKGRLCLILNNLQHQPICKNSNCSNLITSLQTVGGYTTQFNLYCCRECSRHDPERLEKAKQTMLNNYGVEFPYQNEGVLKKCKQKHRDSFGGKFYNQQHYSEETFNCLNNCEWLVKQHHSLKRPLVDIAKELNVSDSTLNRYMKQHGIRTICTFNSVGEIELRNYIKNLLPEYNVEHNTRGVIGRYELDVYVPSLKLAFEYNGSYWHTNEKGRGKEYHDNKTLLCFEKGIFLVHISDVDWKYKRHLAQQAIKDIVINSKISIDKT